MVMKRHYKASEKMSYRIEIAFTTHTTQENLSPILIKMPTQVFTTHTTQKKLSPTLIKMPKVNSIKNMNQ